METIYGSLKNVFQNLKNEIAEDLLLYSFVLVLFSIPLPYFYNSIAIALFVSVALFNRVKERVKIPIALVFPVLLYLLMVLSLLWTVDLQGSLRALSKGIPLLLIPICFLISPKLRESQKQKIIRFYGYGILVYSIFCLGNAGVRFLLFKNIAVFFYHELVTIDVNAIHVSVYVSLAFFSFLIKTNKSIIDQLALFILTVFLVLLSSKNVSIIFLFLFLVYLIGHTKSESRKKLFAYGFVLISLSLLVFSGKIKERFLIEYQSNSDEKTVNTEISTENGIVYNVSIKRAWSQEYFQANDYFPGTSFRPRADSAVAGPRDECRSRARGTCAVCCPIRSKNQTSQADQGTAGAGLL